MSAAGEVFPGIVVDPEIHHGKPVIAGTRVPVSVVVGHLGAGDTMETVTEAYELTDEQVRAALRYVLAGEQSSAATSAGA